MKQKNNKLSFLSAYSLSILLVVSILYYGFFAAQTSYADNPCNISIGFGVGAATAVLDQPVPITLTLNKASKACTGPGNGTGVLIVWDQQNYPTDSSITCNFNFTFSGTGAIDLSQCPKTITFDSKYYDNGNIAKLFAAFSTNPSQVKDPSNTTFDSKSGEQDVAIGTTNTAGRKSNNASCTNNSDCSSNNCVNDGFFKTCSPCNSNSTCFSGTSCDITAGICATGGKVNSGSCSPTLNEPKNNNDDLTDCGPGYTCGSANTCIINTNNGLPSVKTDKPSYAIGETMVVIFNNLPTGAQGQVCINNDNNCTNAGSNTTAGATTIQIPVTVDEGFKTTGQNNILVDNFKNAANQQINFSGGNSFSVNTTAQASNPNLSSTNTATNPCAGVTNGGSPSGCLYNPLPTAGLTDIFLWIIKGFLGIIGIWSVMFIIIGGFRMVLAAGNEEAIGVAKKTITYAIIGLVVALLSFSIVAIIQNILHVDVKSLAPPATSFLEVAKMFFV